MVLIMRLFVVELYFFFMDFREGAADIVFDDLEVKSVRMRRANLSRFALFMTTKISHLILIEMKISFLHVIPQYPMNRNQTATDLKLTSFCP